MSPTCASRTPVGLALMVTLGVGAVCVGALPRGSWSEEEVAALTTLSPVPAPPPSPSNRYADDAAAAALGRALFEDPRLSVDGSVSCATCHDPERHFTDGLRTAVGLGEGRRNTPAIGTAAHLPFLTWDGRKDSLWSQALGPIESPVEMGSHRLLVAELVRSAYREPYEEVFGPLPAAVLELESSGVTVEERWAALSPIGRAAVTRVFTDVGKAIEAFERRLSPGRTPFDDYVAALRTGDPKGGGHLSAAAERGLRAFLGDAGCVHCHGGPLFTDLAFHRLGLPEPGASPDPGRRRGIEQLLADPFSSAGPMSDGVSLDLVYLDAGGAATEGAFKTPSLRDVAGTAPYGHAGQFATLEEMLEFYRRQRREAPPGTDPILPTMGDFDVADMAAFLRSLGPGPGGGPDSGQRTD